MRYAFFGFNELLESPSVPYGISSWDTSSVTDMANMFQRVQDFNVPLDSWNTSSVKNMKGMFSNAEEFNQPIGSWDTSSVRDMSQMFQEASSFNQPLGAWDLSSIDLRNHDLASFLRDAGSFN